MIDRESDDYKIAANELGRTVALAIDKFKAAVGCYRCSIETTDYEYDYEYNSDTGGRVKDGSKIGINIYATDAPDKRDDDFDDDDDE